MDQSSSSEISTPSACRGFLHSRTALVRQKQKAMPPNPTNTKKMEWMSTFSNMYLPG